MPRTAARKAPRQERSRATVDAILDATAQVLTRRGLDGATTNRIAEVAGVSVGSLYQYFPNKDALIAALVERHLVVIQRDVVAELARIAKLSVPEAVRAMVGLWLGAHAASPEIQRIILEQVPRAGRMTKVRAFQQVLHAAVSALLTARRKELVIEDVDTAAFLVVSVIGAVAERAVLFQPERLADPTFADAITTMVVGYLCGDGPKARTMTAGPVTTE